MTRKRFIKLLMSYGLQRNAAQLRADMVQARGLTYEEAYAEFITEAENIYTKIADAISNIVDAAAAAAQEIVNVISAAVNSEEFQKALQQTRERWEAVGLNTEEADPDA